VWSNAIVPTEKRRRKEGNMTFSRHWCVSFDRIKKIKKKKKKKNIIQLVTGSVPADAQVPVPIGDQQSGPPSSSFPEVLGRRTDAAWLAAAIRVSISASK
jgi:hypothetical protein